MARKNAVRALPEVPTQVLPLAELLAGRALYNPRRISDHDASELQGSIASFGLVERTGRRIRFPIESSRRPWTSCVQYRRVR